MGTPPQAFSLIVDTGSSVTAIPCAGCRQCGQHTNPRFEPDSSFTFQHAPCGGPLYCTSCSRGACGYRVSYQEGSSYSGFLARDVIRIGVGGACVALERFPFGYLDRQDSGRPHGTLIAVSWVDDIVIADDNGKLREGALRC